MLRLAPLRCVFSWCFCGVSCKFTLRLAPLRAYCSVFVVFHANDVLLATSKSQSSANYFLICIMREKNENCS